LFVVKRLFVCYSRRDSRHVIPLVKLMRVTGAAVFRDEDSIAPGQRWRAEIATGLESADTVLVFWSAHASSSAEVRTEYEAAIAGGKALVPVLLDSTPLATPLQQYQFLDFSELFIPHSPEGLERHARDLINLLLVRIFPEAEPQ
jgi:TIR domain-containing protein